MVLPTVALAAAINSASVTDGVAIRGYGTALLIQTATTVQAAGTRLNGSFVFAVAALSRIRAFHGMAIGNVWACFVKTDGTAVALSLADGSEDATVATWTGVAAIATAYKAIVAINSSGALLVANGAAYAGLDSTSISALNARFTFSSALANIDTLHAPPEFALAVSGLA